MKHPGLVKRMENFKNEEDFEEMTLLQTIRIPKNLLYLTEKLPQANYEKIPNKKNLSFSNNKNNYQEKGKIKLKKNLKKVEKTKEYSENKENKDKNANYENNEDEINMKKYVKNDNESDDGLKSNKKKKQGSLDLSHLSGNNGSHLKVIKNTDNIEINNSVVREKSTKNDKEKRIKDINSNNGVHLPNIKNQGSVDDIRGARNK